MKNVSSTFKENIKKYGRQIDAKVKFRDVPQLYLTYNEESRNKLNINRTEVITSGAGSNQTIRNFNENQVWVGITRNNYFYNSNINSYNINNETNTVELNIKSNYYGLGFPTRLEPNKSYTISKISDLGVVVVGFFDENGNYLSNITSNTFTVPSNAYWSLIVLAGSTSNTDITMSNIQVEEGTKATEYTPYDPHGGQYYLDGESTQEVVEESYKETSGKVITINDVETNKALKVTMCGESNQDGTPTPDTPIEVQTVTGEQSVTVCGENLFNVNGNLTNVNLPTQVIDDKIIIPSASGNPMSALFDFIKVKENEKYTISYKVVQGKARIGLRLYDSNKNIINTSSVILPNLKYLAVYSGYYLDNTQVTTTIPKGIAYIRVMTVAMNNNGENNIYEEYMIEQNNEKSLYKPYQGQTHNFTLEDEYCSLPNGVKDTIEKIGGVWKRCQRVGKVVLNGIESWSVESNRYYTSISGKKDRTMTTGLPYLLSNYFIRTDNYNNNLITGEMREGASNVVMFCYQEKTLAEFKTWLSTHNVSLYYELATPIYTDIEDEDLLNLLNSLELYEGTTNINSTMPMDLKYNYVYPSPSPECPSEIINKYKAGTYKTYINNKWYYITIAEDLKSVGEVADRLWLDVINESVEIVKNIDIEVFDGTETFSIDGNNFFININDAKGNIESPLLSNYFKYNTTSEYGNIRFGRTNSNLIFSNAKIPFPLLENFQTWLSIHNTQVQYQLAEAGSIECGLSDDGIYREGMPYEEITATKEDINSIVPWFKTSLFKTVMCVLEIDSNIEIKPTTKISAEIGVKFGDSPYEYIQYNDYIVYSCERQEDTESYKIVAYDKMVESMIDYNMAVTYPITVRDYLIAVFNNLGWSTDNIPETFINYDKEIQSDIHSGISYTYRDVLDELATITGSFIYAKNGIPTLEYIADTNETIDEEYLSQDDVTIGDKYFINSLVFSRAEESDNIFRKDDTSIEEKGLHEFRIADNQILSTNDRDTFIDELFNYLKTLEFHMFDVKTTGIMIFDAVDKFNITVHNNIYQVILLNNEITVDQDIEEHLYCDEPEETKTDYKSADNTDKKINRTYILVDKQNQTISNVVEKQTQAEQDINNNYQELTQKLNDKATVESVATVTQKVETLQSSTDFYIGVTKDIQENGVSKVKTEKGFTFDDDGMTIDETGSKVKANYDTTGIKVVDKTGATEQNLLKAGYDEELGETVVEANNMIVKKYLIVADSSRTEAYVNPVLGGKGTGTFNI